MSGRKHEASRAIVDLAQADLPIDRFKEELLRVLDEDTGIDTGIAVREAKDYLFVPYNTEEKQLELIKQSARFAKTRYAQDILPVFAQSTRVGACLDIDFYTTDRSRRASIYHREVLAPAGVRSMMLICARWQGQALLRLNLNRHGRQPFRRTDLEKVLGLLPTLEAAVAARFAREPSQALACLTPREREIAELVSRGLTTAQIGTVLGTSPYTVRNQLTRIYEKLEIESRAELAAQVVRAKAAL